MPISIVSTSLENIISPEEGRAFIQTSETADNTLVGQLLLASLERAQTDTGRLFLWSQLNLWLTRFPCDGRGLIVLPFPPLISVDEITYLDGDDTVQTLDSDDYVAAVDCEPGIVGLVANKSWPSTASRGTAAHQMPVKISFTCGLAETAQDVPNHLRGRWEQMKLFAKSQARQMFNLPNMVENSGRQPAVIPLHIASLLESVRDHYGYPDGTFVRLQPRESGHGTWRDIALSSGSYGYVP